MCLHDAINALQSLILAREKLNINSKNLNLLIRQVENDKIRRDRGQITNTDVAQSEVLSCRCPSTICKI